MDDWKRKIEEVAPGLHLASDKAPHALELVKDLLEVLHPELRGMTIPKSPQRVWLDLLQEVRTLKENDRGH